MLVIKKMVSDAAQLTAAASSSLSAAIKPRCVVEAGVQANYLAVAPGKLLMHLLQFVTVHLVQTSCVVLKCTGRLYWRLWETSLRK